MSPRHLSGQRPHLWRDGECRRCFMRAGWAGASDLCRGRILDEERPPHDPKRQSRERQKARAEARR
jgi:hypothetical protein